MCGKEAIKDVGNLNLASDTKKVDLVELEAKGIRPVSTMPDITD